MKKKERNTNFFYVWDDYEHLVNKVSNNETSKVFGGQP